MNFLYTMMDKLTGFITQLSGDHRYIHEGKAFSGLINTGSISGAYNISFTTPKTGVVHWRPAGITTSANYIAVVMTEGETFTSGTAIAPFNRNRFLELLDPVKYKSKITDMVKGSTCTPAGKALADFGLGTAGTPVARTGGGDSSANELPLAQNTKYNIAITPGGSTVVTLELFWYEEDKGGF